MRLAADYSGRMDQIRAALLRAIAGSGTECAALEPALCSRLHRHFTQMPEVRYSGPPTR